MKHYTDKTPIIPGLKIESVKPGGISRYWVHVVSNGLDRPMHVPIIIAKGHEPGPVLGLTAAVHGNELNGIPVIQRVFQQIDIENLKGTLVGVPIVNVPSYLAEQRIFTDGIDLNRIFPGKRNGTVSEVYAHRIMARIIRHFDYLIDLHTASFGRINSYYIRANMKNEITAKMAMLQNPEIVVNNEGGDGTLRAAAFAEGIHSITVEVGNPHRFQQSMIDSGIEGVQNVMSMLKMHSRPISEPDEPAALCKKSYWMYTRTGGLLTVLPDITDWVEKGELIAVVKNVFGDVKAEYKAPERGIVIGKSVNPVNQSGSRILHLGIPNG